MKQADPNPYASPNEVGERLQAVVPVQTGNGDQRATLAGSSLLYRRIDVQAPVRATIVYIGRTLRDKILVNDQLVCWRLPILGLSHAFEFKIPTQSGPIPARIIVDVNMWLQMRLFELQIDGEAVYSETLVGSSP